MKQVFKIGVILAIASFVGMLALYDRPISSTENALGEMAMMGLLGGVGTMAISAFIGFLRW